jgi:serine protease Do
MPGEVCIAIGNPYGYPFSLTDGRVSATHRDVAVGDSSLIYRRAIQTNTEINPGNSGGPLINVDGEMIGINVALRQGATGIAFAIPVDQVVEVAAKLIGELVDQQIIHGLKVSQIEPSNYDAIKRFIIRVDSVESNSPAALAGIQKGDFLKGIGKYTLTNKLDFYRALLSLKANDEVAFTFFRNNELSDAVVAVGAAKNNNTFARRDVSAQPAATAPKTAGNNPIANNSTTTSAAQRDKLVWENMGLQYAPIPEQEYKKMYPKFVLEAAFPNGGMLVKAVRPGSPAEEANLAAGDIIVAIEDYQVVTANDLRYFGAQEWSKLQTKYDSLRADVIRDNEHKSTNIPLR